MQIYQQPVIAVLQLDDADIITTSGGDNLGEPAEGWGE